MSATRYQLLYRYINEATNVAITNNMQNEYIKSEDFQTICHPIQSDDVDLQLKAEDALEELISYGNSADNPKYDMIFAYTGTKKVRHEVLIGTSHAHATPEYPYVIKDQYIRIQMSPWFVHATYGSLEAALEKAKILVDIIGIDNVKLIKLVSFDQFVKIQ